MYRAATDAEGICHAAIEAADADQAIAKYLLLTGSAFFAYLSETRRKRRSYSCAVACRSR